MYLKFRYFAVDWAYSITNGMTMTVAAIAKCVIHVGESTYLFSRLH